MDLSVPLLYLYHNVFEKIKLGSSMISVLKNKILAKLFYKNL